MWVFLSADTGETRSEYWVWFGSPPNQAGNNRLSPEWLDLEPGTYEEKLRAGAVQQEKETLLLSATI